MTSTNDAIEFTVDRPTPKESRWLIALVFIGVILRILLMVLRSSDLKTDPDAYVAHAETLLQTGGFCVPGTDRPTAFRPPLYPVLLAGLQLIGLKTSMAVALVNLTSGAILIIATWWMARVIGLRGGWPNLTAAAAGLDPLLLRYSVLPMTETLSAAFVAVALLKTLRLWQAQAGDPSSIESPVRSAVAAGICFGLGGLCRPVIFLTCAVISIVTLVRAILIRDRYPAGHLRNRLVVLSAIPASVAAFILMPWLVRNAIQFERFIPATTHGGYTLLLANNPIFYREVVQQPGQPAWQRESLEAWQQLMIHEMLADGVEPGQETVADQWQYAKAVDTINSDRKAFRQSIVLRWKRFWALRPSVEQANTSRLFTKLAAAWYMLIFTGLLLGFVLCVFRRAADIQLLWWAILSFLLLHTFYWTNTRMRAPLTTAIVVLSAIGWHYATTDLWAKAKRTNHKKHQAIQN